ncbi:YrhB domain-containing protein [Amycolatopsis sp. 195334CR]|uniref:YrhB domain-containing protein n=1 Tax=Amycolatopsis sp. 195334CR TaxID=2814588 RepID=UPI001A908329|nr:YrhB domain-containing protein [Amycolatopsis sp. 195334CR]MBN6035616.1 ADP-ribosylglycohydrolase family protein [Amycolatopsis sp. 195334CR]
MEAAEAVARVEDWLRAVHGPDQRTVRVDTDKVRRVPEGWSVPYNAVAYLDGGDAGKEIFPPPNMVVREPDGQVRQAAPHPGGLSIPARYPGREHWKEIVDREFRDSGLSHLGVPLAAVGGWQQVLPDGSDGDEERENPDYLPGPLRLGRERPRNPLEYLLAFHDAGWLDRERFLIGLVSTEVFIPIADNDRVPRTAYDQREHRLLTYSDPRHLPEHAHRWWHVDLATLMKLDPAPNLNLDGGPQYRQQVTGAELTAILATYPRFKQTVDKKLTGLAASQEIKTFAAEAAAKIALPTPVSPPTHAVDWARRNGYDLTDEEIRLTVLGRTWRERVRLDDGGRWPVDLASNGLQPGYGDNGEAVPRLNTFGKYFEQGNPGFKHGWHRITGAYAGFAVGEALGIHGTLGEDVPLGPLTQQLLFLTEGIIRSPHREDPEQEGQFAVAAARGLLRWLHTQGEPVPGPVDGWLAQVPELRTKTEPDAGELAALRDLAQERPGTAKGPGALLVALPAALTNGYAGEGITGGVAGAARQLAALTHGSEFDIEAAAFLATLFDRLLTKDKVCPPVTSARALFTGNSWDALRHAVNRGLMTMDATSKIPLLPKPSGFGPGTDTATVLSEVLSAVSGYENYPDLALHRSVTHDGRRPLTGALAGALIGARVGLPGLPWVSRLRSRYLVEHLASDAFWHFDQYSPVFESTSGWARRYPRS